MSQQNIIIVILHGSEIGEPRTLFENAREWLVTHDYLPPLAPVKVGITNLKAIKKEL